MISYFFKVKHNLQKIMVPKKVFFTKGVGFAKHDLQSFELALRDAGIEKCNLVNVSSIVPPKCEIISKQKGVECLKAGEITYCVLSRNSTNEPNRGFPIEYLYGTLFNPMLCIIAILIMKTICCLPQVL